MYTTFSFKVIGVVNSSSCVRERSCRGHRTDSTAPHLQVFAPRLKGMTKSVILLGAGPPLLVPLELKWDAALDESELTSARSPEVMELPVRDGETSLSMTQRSTTGSSDSWSRSAWSMFKKHLSELGSALNIFSYLTAEAPCGMQWEASYLHHFTVHLPAILVVHVSNNASDGCAHFLYSADVSAVGGAWLGAGWSDWLTLKK